MTLNSNELRQLAADTHAIILAAGLGTRLKENTRSTPKCLIPVSGQPILERMLESLAALGMRHVTIVVGYLDHAIRQFVQEWLQGGQALDVSFVVNDLYAQTGSVRSLELALQAIHGGHRQQHLLLIEGDVVVDRRLLQLLLRQGTLDSAAATLLAPYEPVLSGTFATVAGGLVTAWLHESVREPGFDLASSFKTVNLSFVRCGSPREQLLAQVSGVIAEAGAKAPLEYAMHRLVLAGLQIRAVVTDGLPWFEVDTPEDLDIANAMFPPLVVAA